MWPFTRDNAIKSLEADTQFLKTPCGLLHQKILADLTILRDRAGNYIFDLGNNSCHARFNGDGTNDIRSF
jgi:hypothetical protein